MKIQHLFYLLVFTLFLSCNDDISDEKFRNENYVFYQEDGRAGKWLKISETEQQDLGKSKSTYFFPNGDVYAEMEVLDSFPNRVVKYYNKNKNLNRVTTFKSDSIVSKVFQDGLCRIYHPNIIKLKAVGTIKNNMRQGVWKFYREDGKTIREISEYINDTLHGNIQVYWENKNLKEKAIFVKGKLFGESFHYYETGELECQGFRKNDSIHGIMKKFYKNGVLKSKEKYWHGHITDTSIYFFDNEKIRKKLITHLDKTTLNSTGKGFEYYEDGVLKVFSEVKNQKSHGDFRLYNENGIMIEKSQKVNNKHQGFFTLYYDSGVKKLKGFIDNEGYYHGKLKHFNEDGKLSKMYTFDNGTVLDSIFY
ncbi:toxin-antitoxin system YwqK family antitoxin [Kordia sp.]|uniref:toxin-antitoxin system YwqK family antitoxin n=1 Tax=Kordia sp. TaxID=1965332 RepID=UPI003B591E60